MSQKVGLIKEGSKVAVLRKVPYRFEGRDLVCVTGYGGEGIVKVGLAFG